MGKQWKEWETILGGSKITEHDDCSHEIKRCLLLGKDSNAGRDWGQEEKGTTEDEMAELASLTQWT